MIENPVGMGSIPDYSIWGCEVPGVNLNNTLEQIESHLAILKFDNKAKDFMCINGSCVNQLTLLDTGTNYETNRIVWDNTCAHIIIQGDGLHDPFLYRIIPNNTIKNITQADGVIYLAEFYPKVSEEYAMFFKENGTI